MPTHAITDNPFGDLEVAVYQRKTILTNAQIKALPTTPIELVPTPGAGKLISVVGAWLRFDFTAGAYTNIDATYVDVYLNPTVALPMLVKDTAASVDNIPFALANTHNYQLSNLFNQYTAGYPIVSAGQDGFFVNQPIALNMTNAAGNLTGGHANNSASVTVYYQIVDL